MPGDRDEPIPNAPFPRHLMTVAPAADRTLAVVQMERNQPLEEPLAPERFGEAVPGLGPREIEPRRVQVAGVDQDAQALRDDLAPTWLAGTRFP